MGISKQLVKSGVKKIGRILDAAKSSYIQSFLKLARQIQVFNGLIIKKLLKKFNFFIYQIGWIKTS